MNTSRLKCSCGAVELKLTGQLLLQYYCHCDDCQAEHGALAALGGSHHVRRLTVTIVPHNPPGLFPPYRGYVHAAEVVGGSRLLFISGLNGFEEDGTTMPESFEDQAELIWKHIRTILSSAGMEVSNLVSLRTYLADPKYDEANARMRATQLGLHRVASTVVCCQLLEPRWKLEVEAVAVV